MDKAIAFMELKYGHIYGGTPWKKVVNDASILIYKPDTDEMRIYTKQFRSDLQIVLSNGVSDDLGITVGRNFQVLDMGTQRRMSFKDDFELPRNIETKKKKEADKIKMQLNQFMTGIMKYQDVETLVTFGGSRDVTLCKQAGVRFHRDLKIVDTQRLLQRYTKHLFSLNMISQIVNYEYEFGWIRSNNCEYHIKERTQTQMRSNTATFDVCRQFLAHREFMDYQQSMIIKAALQMQKVQEVLKERQNEKEA
jgi:hypothetical protein|tara:strand:- start:806 stop:1558 length:753 start_codon:yes stop_codon:yes gene_type:complete